MQAAQPVAVAPAPAPAAGPAGGPGPSAAPSGAPAGGQPQAQGANYPMASLYVGDLGNILFLNICAINTNRLGSEQLPRPDL